MLKSTWRKCKDYLIQCFSILYRSRSRNRNRLEIVVIRMLNSLLSAIMAEIQQKVLILGLNKKSSLHSNNSKTHSQSNKSIK